MCVFNALKCVTFTSKCVLRPGSLPRAVFRGGTRKEMSRKERWKGIRSLMEPLLRNPVYATARLRVIGDNKQGRSDGGYIGIANQSTLNFLCGCFVSLTQDKFDIVPDFEIAMTS